jgi:hypothetical protein
MHAQTRVGGQTTPRERAVAPIVQGVGRVPEPVLTGDEMRELLAPLELEARIFQPVESRNTWLCILHRAGYILHCWQMYDRTSTQ